MSTVVTSENLDLPDRIFFARGDLIRRFVCRDGYTPMTCAISTYSNRSNMTIEKMVAVCQLLILSGANVNSRDKAYARKRIVFVSSYFRGFICFRDDFFAQRMYRTACGCKKATYRRVPSAYRQPRRFERPGQQKRVRPIHLIRMCLLPSKMS